MLHATVITLLEAGGTPPPGSDRLTLIASWILWIATAMLGTIVVISGVKIALAGHGRGGAGEHGASLLFAMAGTIVCAVSASIVTLLS